MKLAIYLSLSASESGRLKLLTMLSNLHRANDLEITLIFISGQAAEQLVNVDSPLKYALEDLTMVKVCSTSAEAHPILADTYSVDGLGSWVEASVEADRVIAL